MLSLHTARKPAPMLARGALWLGRRGGATAFGNAIGQSITDEMSRPKVPDVASPQEKADIIRMFGGQEGLDSVMRERLAAGRGWDASVRAGRQRRDDLFGEMSYSNSVSDYGLTGSRAADRAILGGLADQRPYIDFGVAAGEVFARDSQGGTARYLGYVNEEAQGVQVTASRNAWLPDDYRMAFGGVEIGQSQLGRDVGNFFLAIQGASELLYTGTRNGLVKVGSGFVSVPALRNGSEDAAGFQNFLQQKYEYTPRSRGAAMLGQALAPVAGKIQSGLQWTRNTSERYLGDGWTTALGVGLEVGVESAATVFGLRGLKAGYQASMNGLYRSGVSDYAIVGGDRLAFASQRGAINVKLVPVGMPTLTEHAVSARKGFPGVRVTENGGPTFVGTDYLYPISTGQSNVVEITLTGSRRQDFVAANRLAGLESIVPEGMDAPKGYTWHHVDNYDPYTGRATLELVQQGAHRATQPHAGSVVQWEIVTGQKYKR